MDKPCVKEYLSYKRSCFTEERPTALTLESVNRLNYREASELYKKVLKDFVRATDCLSGREWVKKNCFDDNIDFGHQVAIEFAKEDIAATELSMERLVQRMQVLRTLMDAEAQAEKLEDARDQIESLTLSNKKQRRPRRSKSPTRRSRSARSSSSSSIDDFYEEAKQTKLLYDEIFKQLNKATINIAFRYFAKEQTERQRWMTCLLEDADESIAEETMRYLFDHMELPIAPPDVAGLREVLALVQSPKFASDRNRNLRAFEALFIREKETITYKVTKAHPEYKEEVVLSVQDYLFGDVYGDACLDSPFALKADIEMVELIINSHLPLIYDLKRQAEPTDKELTSTSVQKSIEKKYGEYNAQFYVAGILELARFVNPRMSLENIEKKINWGAVLQKLRSPNFKTSLTAFNVWQRGTRLRNPINPNPK